MGCFDGPGVSCKVFTSASLMRVKARSLKFQLFEQPRVPFFSRSIHLNPNIFLGYDALLRVTFGTLRILINIC